MLQNAVHRFSFACAVALLAAAGCSGDPVGRICDLGQKPGVAETVVASPSLDCVSRTCLQIALEKTQKELDMIGSRYPGVDSKGAATGLGLCTDSCTQDSDCERVPESPCVTGFTCGIPARVGAFCCEKFCICKDYIVIPDTGLKPPNECNADDASNGCCNLPGRRGNAQYPLCK